MPSYLPSLLPTVLWTALVAFALLVPGGLSDGVLGWADWFADHGGDKIVHMALFFGQAFWVSRLLDRLGRSESAPWLGTALAALYGLILEGAQVAVPGRGFEVWDVVANTAGALLWLALRHLWVRR